jgi:hypothetical protein
MAAGEQYLVHWHSARLRRRLLLLLALLLALLLRLVLLLLLLALPLLLAPRIQVMLSKARAVI